MPTYVYKFLETGETVEVQQSFADETLTEAVNPRTGTTMPVKKVFQPVGVTFKGDGFYKTDSRSTSKAGAAASGDSSTSGAAATPSTADTSSGTDKKTTETPSTTSAKESKPSTTSTESTGGSTTKSPGGSSTKPGTG